MTRRGHARRRLHGPGAAGCALAFLLVLGAEAFAVRACPHHLTWQGEDQAAETAASTSTASRIPPRSEEPGPVGHAHGGVHSSGGADHGGDVPCTCVGLCHVSAAAPLGTSPPAVQRTAAEVQVRGLASPEEAPPTRTPYLLPFANGPPLPA